MVGFSRWFLLTGRHISRGGGQNRKLRRAHALNGRHKTERENRE